MTGAPFFFEDIFVYSKRGEDDKRLRNFAWESWKDLITWQTCAEMEGLSQQIVKEQYDGVNWICVPQDTDRRL